MINIEQQKQGVGKDGSRGNNSKRYTRNALSKARYLLNRKERCHSVNRKTYSEISIKSIIWNFFEIKIIEKNCITLLTSPVAADISAISVTVAVWKSAKTMYAESSSLS